MRKHNQSPVMKKGVSYKRDTSPDVYEDKIYIHVDNAIDKMSELDLVNEFEQITNKKSKLSKSMREKVIEMVKELYVTV